MYQFEHELQRERKIYKAYVILFIVSALFNVISFFVEGNILRGVVTLLFSPIILHYGLRKKLWAELFIKFTVWLHIVFVLVLILTITIQIVRT
ncbi:hypothetical protein D0463_13620 [Bacillus sp. V59.32b]|nr:hypothetical protein D0463_13620 [Bacillus sp. V59.32b]